MRDLPTSRTMLSIIIINELTHRNVSAIIARYDRDQWASAAVYQPHEPQ